MPSRDRVMTRLGHTDAECGCSSQFSWTEGILIRTEKICQYLITIKQIVTRTPRTRLGPGLAGRFMILNRIRIVQGNRRAIW